MEKDLTRDFLGGLHQALHSANDRKQDALSDFSQEFDRGSSVSASSLEGQM